MKKNTILNLCIAAVVFCAGMAVIKPSSFFGEGGQKAGQESSLAEAPVHKSGFLLNTFVDITLYDSGDASILDHAMALCKEYEMRFSRTIETSEIYRLNHRSPDEQTFTLSDETAELIGKALHFSEVSHGAFDITTEPLSSLWDFTGNEHVIPPEESIQEAVRRVGYENLQLDGNRLTFLSPDTTIDLGAIAKGYIADRIKDYLVDAGVTSATINLGGNVLCVGERIDNTPFRIGLQKPFAETSETFEVLGITDMSVVTSGVYERHFVVNGKNYHHILNPFTGFPYDNGLISVTILSEASVDGDGLSTTCFSLGLDEGLELLNSLDGVYGCFIDEDYNVYYSDGMEAFILERPKGEFHEKQ